MVAKEEKINPCPYCGSGNVEMLRYHGLYGIECRDCYRPSWSYYTTKRTAISKWNSKKEAS